MFISLKFSHTIPEQTQMAQVQTKSVTQKSKTDKVIITMITKEKMIEAQEKQMAGK